MEQPTLKRQITQEELDAAYGALRTVEAPQSADGQDGSASEASDLKLDNVGIHIEPERTNIAFFNAENKLSVLSIGHGYEEMDKLLEALPETLKKEGIPGAPLAITASGKVTHFVSVKTAKLNRSQLLRAIQVALKSSSGRDWSDPQYLQLPAAKGADEVEHFAGVVEPATVEKIFRHLKRLKFKIASWDADILCYARTADLLWKTSGNGDSTRFLLLLDWDNCYLLIQSADGSLIAPRLPIGVNSFLEHLVKVWEGNNSDSRQGGVLGADPIEVRERKILANQAIHDVYVPLGQQVKAQLFAACNEHGIAPPTHFAVVSVGANLFHLVESLSVDLALEPIAIEKVIPTDGVAALGAAMYDKAALKLNFLPRGQAENLRAFKEMIAKLKEKLPKKSLIELPPGTSATVMTAGLVGGIVVLGGMIGYPIWQRSRVEKVLETRKKDLAALKDEKEKSARNKLREELADRKIALVKVVAGKRPAMTKALSELFGVLPPEIKLQSLAFRETIVTLKGVSRNANAVQTFLKNALSLKLLKDPTPIGLKRDKEEIEFELTFKFRT